MATYHDFRASVWEPLLAETFNSHASTFIRAGREVPLAPHEAVLVPKTSRQNKDVWHCGSIERAKSLAIQLLGFPDTRDTEVRGKWVWVEWNHTGKHHLLPGQKNDNRFTYHGTR